MHAADVSRPWTNWDEARVSEKHLLALGRYAYANDLQRETHSLGDIFIAYKNCSFLPDLPPARINLNDRGALEERSRLAESSEWRGLREPPANARMKAMTHLVYETAVLQLRQGDVITDGVRELCLGEYLGAGNTSHVFASGEDVVKIPFLSAQQLTIPTDVITEGRGFLRRLVALQTFYEGQPNLYPVEIRGVGRDHAWLELERVPVIESGRSFIHRLHALPIEQCDASDRARRQTLLAAVGRLADVIHERHARSPGHLLRKEFLDTLPRKFPGLELKHYGSMPGADIDRMIDDFERQGVKLGYRDVRDWSRRFLRAHTNRMIIDVAGQSRQFAWDGSRWRLLDWE